ncbi:cob(I)yrinic acid a,c-diamide adenosyltransferase [Patescibacteria group bacterium]
MSIYTKKGDKGITSTVSGDRISKSSCQTRSLGAIDELNSFLGVVISFSESREVKNLLEKVQTNLLSLGSILGGSDLKFSKSKTTQLENHIDKWEKQLPKLTNFVHPGGSKSASLLQYSRALARKAEREIVGLGEEQKITPQMLMYLNRLSDYLFTLARVENCARGVEDEIWKRD